MNRTVTIIGAGIAGLEAASILSQKGIRVTMLEKEDHHGGHVARWESLFPDRRNSIDVINHVTRGVGPGTEMIYGCNILEIRREKGSFIISSEGREAITSDALLLATGFDLFDCRKKEEYGYGIYDHVMTSAGMEDLFRSGQELILNDGRIPRRFGIIHCVGSRDEKAGNIYCSKVCCVTGVKQAIEIRERIPGAEIFCFYMDLRMFDRHFEELYLEAQQKWDIRFIRGRLSEAAENADRTITLKVEDTLAGLPMKLTVDMVILLAGFIPSPGIARLVKEIGVEAGTDGFLNPVDEHILANSTKVPGLFLAGTVKGAAPVRETLADARSAALKIVDYLQDLR